jgi:hypothetical protein
VFRPFLDLFWAADRTDNAFFNSLASLGKCRLIKSKRSIASNLLRIRARY